MKLKKVVLAPDSFKGTMSAGDICGLARGAILRQFPECEVVSLPVADGGEGTVDCFLNLPGAEQVNCIVSGPFGEKVRAAYARLEDTAVIEMAAAAGLALAVGRLNPQTATTFGVGELMTDAVHRGCKEIVLGLGGSCTNDGGAGMAAALGARFMDRAGREFFPTGGTLGSIARVELDGLRQRLAGVRVRALCDITNPLYGERGAAVVFGPQKGADGDTVQRLDENLRHYARVLEDAAGFLIDELPGAGAAGGMGAGVAALLGGKLTSGIQTVLDLMEFERYAAGAQLILTGEGRIDSQSVSGKAVSGVAERAAKLGIPVVALVGDIGEGAQTVYDVGVTAIFSINQRAIPFAEAKLRCKEDLTSTVDALLRLLRVMPG